MARHDGAGPHLTRRLRMWRNMVVENSSIRITPDTEATLAQTRLNRSDALAVYDEPRHSIGPCQCAQGYVHRAEGGHSAMRFTRHSLLHSYASILLAGGVSPIYVQEQLGRASIKLTVSTYVR